jgi:hypothetical protein
MVTDCSVTSDTSRRQKLRQSNIDNSPVRPQWWQPDLNQPASTKAEAVHVAFLAAQKVILVFNGYIYEHQNSAPQ